MFSLLALLPGCRHQENHTRSDKLGLLQRVRNMHAGMPGKSHNHGVTEKEAAFGKEK